MAATPHLTELAELLSPYPKLWAFLHSSHLRFTSFFVRRITEPLPILYLQERHMLLEKRNLWTLRE